MLTSGMWQIYISVISHNERTNTCGSSFYIKLASILTLKVVTYLACLIKCFFILLFADGLIKQTFYA